MIRLKKLSALSFVLCLVLVELTRNDLKPYHPIAVLAVLAKTRRDVTRRFKLLAAINQRSKG